MHIAVLSLRFAENSYDQGVERERLRRLRGESPSPGQPWDEHLEIEVVAPKVHVAQKKRGAAAPLVPPKDH